MKTLLLGLAVSSTSLFAAEAARGTTPVLRANHSHGELGLGYLSKASDERLSDFFNFADFDNAPARCFDGYCEISAHFSAPAQVCLLADKDRACAVLSTLYRHDIDAYDNGDHVYTKLESCRALGQTEDGVFVRFRMHEDSASFDRIYSQIIIKCPTE